MTLASPFHHAAIRVLGSYMDIRMRVALFELCDHAMMADRFGCINGRKTVMGSHNRRDKSTEGKQERLLVSWVYPPIEKGDKIALTDHTITASPGASPKRDD